MILWRHLAGLQSMLRKRLCGGTVMSTSSADLPNTDCGRCLKSCPDM